MQDTRYLVSQNSVRITNVMKIDFPDVLGGLLKRGNVPSKLKSVISEIVYALPLDSLYPRTDFRGMPQGKFRTPVAPNLH